MPARKHADDPTLGDGTIIVALNNEELAERQTELITNLKAKEAAEAEKRESASDMRKKLRMINERITVLTEAIRTKSERRDAQQQMFRDGGDAGEATKKKPNSKNGKAARA